MPVLEEVRTVTVDGRLVVPWVVQQALGLEHGGPVRFRVENGTVTLTGVSVPQAAAPSAKDELHVPPRDFRAVLAAELNTLLAAHDRDHVKEKIGQ